MLSWVIEFDFVLYMYCVNIKAHILDTHTHNVCKIFCFFIERKRVDIFILHEEAKFDVWY